MRVVTAAGRTHQCDAVIVTVPLGVLKAGAIRFVPELPAWKQEAVKKLGFGDLNKVYCCGLQAPWHPCCMLLARDGCTPARGTCCLITCQTWLTWRTADLAADMAHAFACRWCWSSPPSSGMTLSTTLELRGSPQVRHSHG